MTEIAIVEDDEQEQQRLLKYLKRYGAENACAFHFSSFNNAYDFLDAKQAFDVVFMDILMPGMTGMEAAEALRKQDSHAALIFVTSTPQYAIRSYEVDALDYIVKPVTYERLTMKMVKVLRVLDANRGGFLVINDPRATARLSTNDIRYVEVTGHKRIYHTVSGEYTEYGSLSELETALNPYDFMRCNACYLVNPRHIRELNSRELLVSLSNGEQLKISQSRRKTFITELTNWLGQGKC